jgi:hypothetical protein
MVPDQLSSIQETYDGLHAKRIYRDGIGGGGIDGCGVWR